MNRQRPPYQVVAVGICPQGLTPGQFAPNVVGAIAQNGGTGTWLLTADDPTLTNGNCVMMVTPGSGSNIPKGISFGQNGQVGTGFGFQAYRNDTGAAVDVECHFIIVKFTQP